MARSSVKTIRAGKMLMVVADGPQPNARPIAVSMLRSAKYAKHQIFAVFRISKKAFAGFH